MTSDLDARASEDLESTSGRSRRRIPSLVMPVLLTLGVLTYELAARPDLGAAIACTKFGWEDFVTARWVRRRDPKTIRGRASFWLFVAAGLWKTAVTGVCVMFAVVFLESLFWPPPMNQPAPPPAAGFAGAMFMAVAGFFCCTLATGAAFLIALRGRVRLWIDRRVHLDRRTDHWPPASAADRRNRAGGVLFTALFLGMLTLLVVINAVVRNVVGWLGFAPGAQDLVDALAGLFCCALLLGFPVLLLVSRDILAQLALARTPAECWGSAPTVRGDSD